MLKALSVLIRHFTTEPHPKPVKFSYYLLGFACWASQTIPESIVIELNLHVEREGSVPENSGLQRETEEALGRKRNLLAAVEQSRSDSCRRPLLHSLPQQKKRYWRGRARSYWPWGTLCIRCWA